MRTALVVAALLASAHVARADETADCSAAYQNAQRQKMAGRFREARAELLVCAKPSCPKFIATDCTGWLAEVEQQLPAIVFAALDENGRDIPKAEVRVDGELVVDATDGLPHPFDPGEHAIELRSGTRAMTERLLLRTGERSRRVELRFARTSAATRELVRRPIPASAFAFGGLALAFVATSSVLWAAGTSDANAYDTRCLSGPCTSAERDRVMRELVAGDVSLGLAIASASIATILVLTRKSVHAPLVARITF
jgi:hypothetical protein